MYPLRDTQHSLKGKTRWPSLLELKRYYNDTDNRLMGHIKPPVRCVQLFDAVTPVVEDHVTVQDTWTME